MTERVREKLQGWGKMLMSRRVDGRMSKWVNELVRK
jgi:hypothetical protein